MAKRKAERIRLQNELVSAEERLTALAETEFLQTAMDEVRAKMNKEFPTDERTEDTESES